MNTKSKRQAKGGRRNIILGSDFKATQFWSFCWLESNAACGGGWFGVGRWYCGKSQMSSWPYFCLIFWWGYLIQTVQTPARPRSLNYLKASLSSPLLLYEFLPSISIKHYPNFHEAATTTSGGWVEGNEFKHLMHVITFQEFTVLRVAVVVGGGAACRPLSPSGCFL